MAPDDNASVLRFIFQQSLNSGCVPFDWKFALVNPVHKKGPRSDPANYRPISLTCISYKLLEHVISSSIMKHLDQNNILSPFQHGFRLRHSCETQLLATVHDLAKGIDQHLQSNLVVLDFTKAFDSVPNKHLFLKLQHSGINGCTLRWLQDFLSNRSQATVVGGTGSTACHVLSGVPQGSVWGLYCFCPMVFPPIFVFLLMIVWCTLNSRPTSLLLSSNLTLTNCLLGRVSGNSALIPQSVSSCTSHANALHLLPTTSYTIRASLLLKLTHTLVSKYPTISAGDCRISSHETLGFVRRNLYHCRPLVKETAYMSLVRPSLEYCRSVWDPRGHTNMNKLEMVQRRVARFVVNDYNKDSSVSNIISKQE